MSLGTSVEKFVRQIFSGLLFCMLQQDLKAKKKPHTQSMYLATHIEIHTLRQ